MQQNDAPKFEGQSAGEMLQLAPQGDSCSKAHLKPSYTNPHSMRNKEEEAEALAQFQRYVITGISKRGEINPVTGVPGWIVIDPSAGTG